MATAVDSCSAGTMLGRDASSAGSKSAAATPKTAATSTMCGRLNTWNHKATTRLAAATAWAASQPSMIFLRLHRSTSAPPGSPARSCAAATVPRTMPDPVAEPVTASTSNGNAMVEAYNASRSVELTCRMASNFFMRTRPRHGRITPSTKNISQMSQGIRG